MVKILMRYISSINKRLLISSWLFISYLFYSEMGLTVSENTGLSDPTQSSDENSLKDLIKAAEQGDTAAQFELGVHYMNGRGTLQDYRKAFEWNTKAAEHGFLDAQNNLGVIYEKGQGVPQDYNKALEWFTKAAEQGLVVAQYNLGVMYHNGTVAN